MSTSIIGFLRGAGYAAAGGALFGLSNFLLAQPILSGGIAVVLTGLIAAFEHKYSIPTPTATN
jgi:hypothetical protein